VVWNLIDELRREGRTIILTTHHLEEAEFLANRIGILAHGEMLVQGSCHYIRERFGCGYYLAVALDPQLPAGEQRREIIEKVKELIKNYREDDQVN
jgi:ATP-binding cassette subfamily A (ABC1) protein 3